MNCTARAENVGSPAQVPTFSAHQDTEADTVTGYKGENVDRAKWIADYEAASPEERGRMLAALENADVPEAAAAVESLRADYRNPHFVCERALTAERALSDRLAEALHALLRCADHTRPADWWRDRPVTLANAALADHAAARSGK